MRLIASLIVLALLAAPALAKDDEEPKPHADDVVEKALERFEKDYESDDMGERIRILRWLGMHRHDDVLRELDKIWLRERDLELRAAAAQGFAHKIHDPKKATRALLRGLDKYDDLATSEPQTNEERLRYTLEARVLKNALASVGALGVRDAWEDIEEFIDHNDDGVAIAMFQIARDWREYRALPRILEWFHYYPDGTSWSGGSTRVDTGAAGNKDAKAAKAKWKAKFGGRAKKARPQAWEAMKEAVHAITGEEITKPEALKEWMKENKLLLRKHGV